MVKKDKSEKKDNLDKKMAEVPEKSLALKDRPAKSIVTASGMIIPSIDPINKGLKKAEFIERRKQQREKHKKLKAYAKKIDDGEA